MQRSEWMAVIAACELLFKLGIDPIFLRVLGLPGLAAATSAMYGAGLLMLIVTFENDPQAVRSSRHFTSIRVMRFLATVIAVSFFSGCLIGLIRWIQRSDAVAYRIVSVGIVVRLYVGLLLFWISYLQLPILSHLQLSRGFWVLSLDGLTYYVLGAVAVEEGFHTMSWRARLPVSCACLRAGCESWG